MNSQPFYKSTFFRTKGVQYSDQLYLRSLCALGNASATSPSVSTPIQAAMLATETSTVPTVFGSQSFIKETVDAAISVKLWSDASSRLEEAFYATPTHFKIPNAFSMGDNWRVLPSGLQLLFQQWDAPSQTYLTKFTTDSILSMMAEAENLTATSITLGDWRITTSSSELVFERLEDGQYVNKGSISA